VNVLLYAFRADSPLHRESRDWLHAVVNGPALYGMAPQVLASLVRISTHRRIYVQPSRLEEAITFSKLLLEQPNCQIIQPGQRHWDIFSDLCRRSDATGNLAQDAWFAALAIESGCEWITIDRDYARFPELRWRVPF
jgi:toxin-antitoxin system PIN domain toxin